MQRDLVSTLTSLVVLKNSTWRSEQRTEEFDPYFKRFTLVTFAENKCEIEVVGKVESERIVRILTKKTCIHTIM